MREPGGGRSTSGVRRDRELLRGRRGPRGPRGERGGEAEAFAADLLRAAGWRILGRNVRVGGHELDIIALEPAASRGPPPPDRQAPHRGDDERPRGHADVHATLVVVEVRSRSAPGFGDATEAVDARKVGRLYRAASVLRRSGRIEGAALPAADAWRVDLLAVVGGRATGWRLVRHIRGLEPP